ncbi:hypothetical protein LXL04_011667 [Taraxacum kok-saghyz]
MCHSYKKTFSTVPPIDKSTSASANWNDYERFGGSRSRFFERNNGLGDIENWRSSRSGSMDRKEFRFSKPLLLQKLIS